MINKVVNCNGIKISNNNKINLISGPCQLESEQHAMDMAGKIKEIASKFGIGLIFKSSCCGLYGFTSSPQHFC